MKNLIAALVLGFSMQASAEAVRVYTCQGQSDPDFANAHIYKDGKKYLAVVSVYYGDGDSYDFDVVEVKKYDDSNGDMQFFVQVEGSHPADPQPEPAEGDEEPTKASRKMKGLQLRIPFEKGVGSLGAAVGPHGEALTEDLECQPAKKK